MSIKNSLIALMVVISCGVYASDDDEYVPLNKYSYRFFNWWYNRDREPNNPRVIHTPRSSFVVYDDPKAKYYVKFNFPVFDDNSFPHDIVVSPAQQLAAETMWEGYRYLIKDDKEACYKVGYGWNPVNLSDSSCQTLKKYYDKTVKK